MTTTSLEPANAGRHITRARLLGLVLVPLLVAGPVIGTTWHAERRLPNARAAVVNLDQMVDVQGEPRPMGRQLAAAIVDDSTPNLTWVLADAPSAAAGLGSGEYAAVVTIPATFSADAMSFATDETFARHASIVVTQSEVAGVADPTVARLVVARAEASLNKTITQGYLDQVFTQLSSSGARMTTLADSVKQLADGSAKLASGLDSAGTGATDLAAGVAHLSTGASSLAGGVTAYTSGVDQSAGGAAQLATGVAAYAGGVAQSAGGASSLAAGASSLAAGLAQLAQQAPGVSQSVADYTRGVSAALAGLSGGSAAQSLATGVTSYTSGAAAAAAGITQLATGADQLVAGVQAYRAALGTIPAPAPPAIPATPPCPSPLNQDPDPNVCAAWRAGVGAGYQVGYATGYPVGLTVAQGASATLLSSTQTYAAGARAAATQAAPLATGGQALATGAQQLADGLARAQAQLAPLASGGTKLASGVAAFNDGVVRAAGGGPTLTTGASRLATGLSTLTSTSPALTTGANELSTGLGRLSAGSAELTSGSSQLASGLAAADRQMPALTDGMTRLATAAHQVADGTRQVSDGLAAQAAIPGYTEAQRTQLSDVLAAPVATSTLDGLLQPTLAWPLLWLLGALWLGALATFTVLRPVSSRAALGNARPAVDILRAVAPGVVLVAAQAVVLALVGEVAMGLAPLRFLAVTGILLLAAVVFAVVNHALTAWLRGWGRLVSVLLVVLPFAGAMTDAVPGILPPLRALSPVWPALHAAKIVATGGSGMTGDLMALGGWLILATLFAIFAVLRGQSTTTAAIAVRRTAVQAGPPPPAGIPAPEPVDALPLR